MSRWWVVPIAILILLGSVALAGGRLLAAPPPQANQCAITWPTEGAAVSGVVEITGFATHTEFRAYGLAYAAGPAPTAASNWQWLVWDVQEQVNGGTLATWDTAALSVAGQPVVPNGVYHLTLVCYRQGSTDPTQVFVRNITVNNVETTPTPAPTDTPEAQPTASLVTPTAVPVEQPPTSTPFPTPTLAPGETPRPASSGGGEEGSEPPIDMRQVRSNFFTGVKVTLLLFALWGLYLFGKAAVRYYLRSRLRR